MFLDRYCSHIQDFQKMLDESSELVGPGLFQNDEHVGVPTFRDFQE